MGLGTAIRSRHRRVAVSARGASPQRLSGGDDGRGPLVLSGIDFAAAAGAAVRGLLFGYLAAER